RGDGRRLNRPTTTQRKHHDKDAGSKVHYGRAQAPAGDNRSDEARRRPSRRRNQKKFDDSTISASTTSPRLSRRTIGSAWPREEPPARPAGRPSADPSARRRAEMVASARKSAIFRPQAAVFSTGARSTPLIRNFPAWIRSPARTLFGSTAAICAVIA